MPNIDVAMGASLKHGWLQGRDIVGDVSNVKNTFSSWDGCMAQSYCKWPVIIAIVIAALTVLSVVTCIIRCACCGMSCCCSCFSCLKCCGNCGGCCDDPKDRKHKHLDDQPYPPQQGYHPQPPMMTGANEPVKYAQFETGPNGHALEPKKVSDDALPPMPSWDTAPKKRILTEEEQGAVEMGDLDPKTGQNIPLMTGAGGPISRTGSPSMSPAISPYGDRPGMNDQHSYMAGANGAPHMGAGALGAGAVGAGAMAMGGRGAGMGPYGRGGPNDHGAFNGGPQVHGYGPPGQALSPMNGPGRGGPGPYNNQFPPGSGQYPPNANGGNFGPPGAMAGEAYDRPPPQRFNSNESERPLMGPSPTRPYPNSGPAPVTFPQESFPQEPSVSPYGAPYRGPGRMVSPPIDHNQGFDFDGRGPLQPHGMSHGGNEYGGNGRRNSPPIDHNQGFDFDGRGPPLQPHGMSYGGDEYGGNGRRNSPPNHSELGGGGGYAGSTAPPSYASRSPPPQSFASRSPPPPQQGGGYGPGTYAPYSPPNERDEYGQGRGLTRPPNSAGRGREAHGWEAL